ncbi:MAG: hypothetical protein NC419_07030 [Muribaculaceae bacterium]|nr:hypothetical protein [Muribaculaceae bacterium]
MNQENIQIDFAAVAALLDQEADRLGGFRKENYEDSFDAYLEENQNVWNSFRTLFRQDTDLAPIGEMVAKCLTDKAKELVDAQNNRIHKERKQLNINLYMVSYLFPALLSCQEYPKKDGKAYQMADIICKKWREAFPKSSISYADFATIQGGFRQKLCYVTTAVCIGLHKPADCQEILLMKKYRDEYLLHQEGGAGMIAEYYDIAPTIVKRIEKEDAPEEKYRYLWDTYLKPCVTLLEEENYDACQERYVEMVEALKKEYFVTGGRR